jgi:hypothetical protein
VRADDLDYTIDIGDPRAATTRHLQGRADEEEHRSVAGREPVEQGLDVSQCWSRRGHGAARITRPRALLDLLVLIDP